MGLTTNPDARASQEGSVSRSLVRWFDRVFYPDYVPRVDDVLCRERVLTYLNPRKRVLDLGAGAGIHEHTNFRGIAGHVSGIDPSPRVLQNPQLDDAKVASAEAIPFDDGTFDVVLAWNVLEHLKYPHRVFAEVARVLKPGGVFAAKTPNRWHYVSLTARLTPHWLHRLVISRLFGWRRPEDVFPTVYRANSLRAMRRLADGAGLWIECIDTMEPRPEYLRFSPLTYPIGIAYERVVNAWSGFRPFRAVLVAVFRKPQRTPDSPP